MALAINFFGTPIKRRERYIFNDLSVPAGPFKSSSIYAGVQDAFLQWWYGHNAVVTTSEPPAAR